jgi:hypothetical protein
MSPFIYFIFKTLAEKSPEKTWYLFHQTIPLYNEKDKNLDIYLRFIERSCTGSRYELQRQGV